MSDFISRVIEDVRRTIESGYYNNAKRVTHDRVSLREAIFSCRKNAVITEFKPASPSFGDFRVTDVGSMALSMQRGGAVGISILTEPKYFKGSLEAFAMIRETVSLPLLMKDFIISEVQVDAASKMGADAVLLIQAVFEKGYSEIGLEDMVSLIHSRGMEVLLEIHTDKEFLKALESEADMIGINNRDLRTLKVDVNITRNILRKYGSCGRLIVSESGITSALHIRMLRETGVKVFLIGTSIMLSDNIESKVREFVEA
ncbi:MAG: indole-3-glycerol-phosphate synthase [Thermoproteota archaeon]